MKKEQNNVEQKVSKKPEVVFRAGNVSASVWKNDRTDPKTKDVITSYSVTVVKSYTTDNGTTWEQTNSFNKHDLPKLDIVCRKATEYLYLNEE